MAEKRATSDTGGQKGRKPERMSLLPREALEALSRQFAYGADKYETYNWLKGYPWSWSYDALQRHLLAWWDGEETDEESGESHLAAVGFHVMALLTFQERSLGSDDRPPKTGRLSS